jgi:hypothetical protein
MGYLALARYRGRSALARRVFERIVESRADQDNEQWHLLILQDLVQRRGLRQSFLLHRLAPWLVEPAPPDRPRRGAHKQGSLTNMRPPPHRVTQAPQ